MWIPATPRRNPTNPDKNSHGTSKKVFLNLQKSGPGGTPEPPESVRDPSGTRPSEENAKKRVAGAKSRRVIGARVGFLTIFESRPGAQNPQKTAPGTKKCVRRRRRKPFLTTFCRFSRSRLRPGTQNRQKISPGTKKCVRRRRRKRFLSFFFAGVVWSRSPDRF